MAEESLDTSATIFQLHKPKPKTSAERVQAYRERQRQAQGKAPSAPKKVERVKPPAVTPIPTVTPIAANVTSLRVTDRYAPGALKLAAFALAVVGVMINGWFARSLGSTDMAGWLFLAIGVASDLAGLAIPSCAAGLWQARHWLTAIAGWLVFTMTLAFAIISGIGFASQNIADVTSARSLHVTPTVTMAQVQLADATAARNRECANGVGKFCREREAVVVDRAKALDAAMAVVEHAADPQTEAATRIVAWVSGGSVNPTGNDFAMLRLILLALLPQVGGILLMVSRPARKCP